MTLHEQSFAPQMFELLERIDSAIICYVMLTTLTDSFVQWRCVVADRDPRITVSEELFRHGRTVNNLIRTSELTPVDCKQLLTTHKMIPTVPACNKPKVLDCLGMWLVFLRCDNFKVFARYCNFIASKCR